MKIDYDLSTWRQEHRKTHKLPSKVPHAQVGWSSTYRKLADEVGLELGTLSQASESLVQFLEPVLDNIWKKEWHPIDWQWK